MRRIKWRVRFKTIKNRDAIVYIYEEGYTGSTVTDIEAAENPIVTDEDGTDEMLSPIRTQTGYLRVIDNGDLDGLMPKNNMQHYVELRIDEKVEWCGYMQADTFSEDWDARPIEVEYPLISGLGVLEGCYLDQTKPMSNIPLSVLVKECLDMANISYSKVYVSDEASVGGTYSAFTLRWMIISRANFFTLSDAEHENGYMKYDAMSAMDVLSEICKFMGWTLHEKGMNIYFVSHGMPQSDTATLRYGVINYYNLGTAQNYESKENRTFTELDTLNIDGDVHRRDVIQGKKKMKVKANFNPVTDTAIQVYESSIGKKGEMNVAYRTSTGWEPRYEQIRMYGGGSGTSENEFLQYQIQDIETSPIPEIHSVEFDERKYYERAGMCYGDYDLYEHDRTDEKINYDYKKALIMNLDTKTGRMPESEKRQYPMARMRAPMSARYSNGAFVLQVSNIRQVRNIDADYSSEEYSAFQFNLIFRVGSKYWSGSSWVSNAMFFQVLSSDNGNIVNGKTLDMPYNGVAGYFMPITEELSGDMELTIYPVEQAEGHHLLQDRLYIEGLTVKYYPEDKVDGKEEKTVNVYQTSVDDPYKENVNVELMMSSYNNNPAGYGLLSSNVRYIENMYYAGIGAERPEKYLLSKLKRVYGRNIEKLTIGVEATELNPTDEITWMGKQYDIVCRSRDWAEEHEEITLMDVVV